MMKVLDPYPERLDAEELQAFRDRLESDAGKRLTERNLARLDHVMEQLIHTSVRFLPKDIWDRYDGNVAIDATFVETSGGLNPMGFDLKRGSADPFAGRYRREGDHDGFGAKTDKGGYELDNGAMTWNQPGENMLFPSLTTCVSFHKPGEIRGQGAKLLEAHQRLELAGGLVLADRAYNNSVPEDFQLPLRLHGWKLVIDYRINDLGLQTQYKDLILVDGNWYVTWRPQELIDANKDFRTLVPDPDDPKKKRPEIDRETFDKRIQNRQKYRMTPKGRPDKQGFQRFTYPEPGTYLAIDRATKKPVSAKSVSRGSITIPVDAGGEDPAIKHLQKFSMGTAEHSAYYGMRSIIESSHSLMKDRKREDLANPGKDRAGATPSST